MRKAALVTLLLVSTTAYADGTPENPAPEEWAAPSAAQHERGSDASFDKRLPPVYPGEIVEDSGQKIKVWSTSGALSVESVPAAPLAPAASAGVAPAIGVIVDERDSPTRHDHNHH